MLKTGESEMKTRKHTIQKRSLTFLLAAVMLLGILSPAALAAEFTIETVIDCRYENAKNFSDGLAAVQSGGKWGYIDEDGSMVIAPAYDFAGDFSEGVAVVGKRTDTCEYADFFGMDEYAYYYDLYLLDKTGRETRLYTHHYQAEESFPLTYYSNADDIESVSSLWFCQCGVINIWGNPYGTDGRQILVDTENSPVYLNYIETADNYPPLGSDSYYTMLGVCADGVIAMRAREYAAGPYMQCFFMDRSGKVTRIFDPIEVDYETGTAAGLTAVYAPNQNRMVAWYATFEEDLYSLNWPAEEHCGALAMDGSWAVEPVYAGCRYFYSGRYFADGMWTVKNDAGKYGTVDKSGNVVIPFEYDFLGCSSEGMTAALKDGRYGYVDIYSKTFTIAGIDGGEAQIDAATHFNGGVAAVYSESSGTAYCIQNIAVDGVLQAIPSTEELDMKVYFPDYHGDSSDMGTIRPVEELMVVQQDGKYGYAQLDFHLDLPDESAMDSWAYDEVCRAIEAGLVPNELQNQYRTSITRADFALLLTEVAVTITGKELDTLVYDVTGRTLDEIAAEDPFTDGRSDAILAAYALGIINGYGNGEFGTYDTITRQDAATMLLRAATAIKADAMDGWGDKLAQASVAFRDGEAFAPYAREAIEVMAALDIMKGVGSSTFDPTGSYTRQQAFITVYRLMVQIMDEAM